MEDISEKVRANWILISDPQDTNDAHYYDRVNISYFMFFLEYHFHRLRLICILDVLIQSHRTVLLTRYLLSGAASGDQSSSWKINC